MPRVVPQLKTITIGGATVGVGIESSSFRHGLVHEGIVELDVLLADGRVVTCRADNAHADLFHAFPNSYGTLGYALRVVARTQPVRPFVRLANVRHREPPAFFADLEARAAGDADFLDGVVFGDGELYLVEGRFADTAPYASDYTYSRIYYRSIRERAEDWLTVRDYLWRWDTDWFWCSKNVGAQNPLLRRLFGRERLNSRTYQRIMRWNSRIGFTRALDRIRGRRPESVIQDVDIPIGRAAEFLAFLRAEVGILPIWICPFRAGDDAQRWVLFPLRPGAVYVNFGFWDVVRHREPRPPGYCNRRIETKATELGGIKSLYSDSYFDPAEFDAAYGGAAYAALKRRYDPEGRFPTLYQKCVQRH
jgi:FAD/FMN-containing dehydrogenase